MVFPNPQCGTNLFFLGFLKLVQFKLPTSLLRFSFSLNMFLTFEYTRLQSLLRDIQRAIHLVTTTTSFARKSTGKLTKVNLFIQVKIEFQHTSLTNWTLMDLMLGIKGPFYRPLLWDRLRFYPPTQSVWAQILNPFELYITISLIRSAIEHQSGESKVFSFATQLCLHKTQKLNSP